MLLASGDSGREGAPAIDRAVAASTAGRLRWDHFLVFFEAELQNFPREFTSR